MAQVFRVGQWNRRNERNKLNKRNKIDHSARLGPTGLSAPIVPDPNPFDRNHLVSENKAARRRLLVGKRALKAIRIHATPKPPTHARNRAPRAAGLPLRTPQLPLHKRLAHALLKLRRQTTPQASEFPS